MANERTRRSSSQLTMDMSSRQLTLFYSKFKRSGSNFRGYAMALTRGITRLDGARGKNKFGAPMFEPEVFPKQIYCIEEGTCDIVGTFRRPPKCFSTPIVNWRPGNCASPSLRPWL